MFWANQTSELQGVKKTSQLSDCISSVSTGNFNVNTTLTRLKHISERHDNVRKSKILEDEHDNSEERKTQITVVAEIHVDATYESQVKEDNVVEELDENHLLYGEIKDNSDVEGILQDDDEHKLLYGDSGSSINDITHKNTTDSKGDQPRPVNCVSEEIIHIAEIHKESRAEENDIQVDNDWLRNVEYATGGLTHQSVMEQLSIIKKASSSKLKAEKILNEQYKVLKKAKKLKKKNKRLQSKRGKRILKKRRKRTKLRVDGNGLLEVELQKLGKVREDQPGKSYINLDDGGRLVEKRRKMDGEEFIHRKRKREVEENEGDEEIESPRPKKECSKVGLVSRECDNIDDGDLGEYDNAIERKAGDEANEKTKDVKEIQAPMKPCLMRLKLRGRRKRVRFSHHNSVRLFEKDYRP